MSLKLNNSMFCVECEEVVDVAVNECPSCGCTKFYPLGRAFVVEDAEVA